MTIGLTIPGVETVHPREDWEQLLPASYAMAAQNPPRQVPEDIWRAVAHYPGVRLNPTPTSSPAVASHLANTHRYYVDQRGYAYGYLWVVDQTGAVWEIRGFDYRSAANKSHNLYTAPIQFLVDIDEPPTAEAMASARAVWREHRRRSGRDDFENRPFGHGQLLEKTGKGTLTTCPGPVLPAIESGSLDLDHDPPIIPDPEEPDHMIEFVKRDNDPAVLVLSGQILSTAKDMDRIAALVNSGRTQNTHAAPRTITDGEIGGLLWAGEEVAYTKSNIPADPMHSSKCAGRV